MSSPSALASVAIPAVVASAVYLILFEGLRGVYTRFFAPRLPASKDGQYPHPGLFAWVPGILSVPEEEVLHKSGMDACVYLRFVWMSTIIMAVLTVLAFPILSSVYATDDNDKSGLLILGLSNVKQQSNRLWATAFMMWPMSALIYFGIWRTSRDLLELRKKSMKKGDSSHYTIMVTKIPDEYNTADKIQAFLEPSFPNQIAFVTPVLDRKEMTLKVKELQKLSLAHLVAVHKAETSPEPPTTKTGCCGCVGETVEAVPYYKGKADELRGEIREEYPDAEYKNAAFVSFKTVSSAVKASSIQFRDDQTWEITGATQPSDVIWTALTSVPDTATQQGVRMGVSCAIVALNIIWAIPMAAGGALANLEQLGDKYSWLSGVESLPPTLIAIIEGFGPTIWRIILMLLLKPILYALLGITGILETSTLESAFFNKYYMFLLVQIYFVTLVSSSLFAVIGDIIDDPISIFSLLGESVPAVAIEMIQYMLLQGLGLGVGKIVRLVGLILTIFFSKMAVVEYQKEQAMKPPKYTYGSNLATNMLMWTITLCYMSIAPLILPFGFIYFALEYVVQKYQLVYVHVPDFETYGLFWPDVASTAMWALFLSQLATMAIVGLKFGAFQQIVLAPLPFITYFVITYIEETIGTQMRKSMLPLSNAANIDQSRPAPQVENFLASAQELNMWTQPCVWVDLDDPLKPPPDFPEITEVTHHTRTEWRHYQTKNYLILSRYGVFNV